MIKGKEMLVIEKEKELHSFLLHTIPATPELRDGKGRRVRGRGPAPPSLSYLLELELGNVSFHYLL